MKDEDQNHHDEYQSSDQDDIMNVITQTQRTLSELTAEQIKLKQQLQSLELRNQPAELFKPQIIQQIDSVRVIDSKEIPPEQLAYEIFKTQKLLENATNAIYMAQNEQEEIVLGQTKTIQEAEIKTKQLLDQNLMRHKLILQKEQREFQKDFSIWNEERKNYLSEVEKMSIQSHESLNELMKLRDIVTSQRSQIQNAAQELKDILIKSKAIRDKVEDGKKKILLIQNLKDEININRAKVNELKEKKNEEKMVLKATKISQSAKDIIEDIKQQIIDLNNQKKESVIVYETVHSDLDTYSQLEINKKKELDKCMELFMKTQKKVFVLEAETRNLLSEYERQRGQTIDIGKENLELHTDLQDEKIRAVTQFVYANSQKIHHVEKVENSLLRVEVRSQISRPSSMKGSRPVRPATEMSNFQSKKRVKVKKQSVSPRK